MQPEPRFGIVADDLTGANDTLVQFAEAGFLARLSLAEPGFRGLTTTVPAALAFVTDARPLNIAHARSRTREAVERLRSTDINQLYVKIDSTMRGTIAGQIAGALDAWGEKHSNPFAVVCPAYPAMGRLVEDGRLFVHGKPVELSPAGTDPVTPVRTSGMADLLPRAKLVPRLPSIPAKERAQTLISAARDTAVVVVDAVAQPDLEVLAATLLEIGPQAVPVGSAGLAAALAGQWAASASDYSAIQGTGSGRTLVVVSSLHNSSRKQARILIERTPDQELLALTPTMDDLRDAVLTETWLKTALPTHTLPSTVMVISPSREGAGKEVRSDGAMTGATVANGLAMLMTGLMDRHGFSNLILIGGDGARAVLHSCGAESVTVRGAIQEGVPLGVINGGRADGVHMVTKAGGFGTPETLVDILETLTHPTPPHLTEANS